MTVSYGTGLAIAATAMMGICDAHAVAQTEAPPDAFAQAQASAAAKNPAGTRFLLSLPEGRTAFHQGEAIPITLSFAGDRNGAYQVSTWEFLAMDEYHVDPISGAAIPDADLPAQTVFIFHGFAPEPLPLAGKPVSLPAVTLNRYYRFDRAGHYRLYVVSHRLNPLPVRPVNSWPTTTEASNIVDFDILPADPAWERSQLDTIRKDLDSRDLGVRRAAATTLSYLATDDAAGEMLNRLKDAPADGDIFIEGLYKARDRSFVLDRLTEALRDPAYAVSDTLLKALVRLDITSRRPIQTVETGTGAEIIRKKAAREKAVQQEEPRTQAKYLRILGNAVEAKRGRAKAVSLAALLTLQAQGPGKATADASDLSRIANRLRPMLGMLSPEEQACLISSPAWQPLQTPESVPYLEAASRIRGAINTHPELYDLREAAIKRLIRLRPAETRRLILSDIRSGKPEMGLDALTILPDAEIPGLDPILKRSFVPNDGTQTAQTQIIAGLIARYGSRSLLPFVLSLPARDPNSVESTYFLAFILRVDGQRGEAMVDRILARQSKEQKWCSLLNGLANSMPSPAVARTVRAHLNDKDPRIARDARSALDALMRAGV